MMHKFKMYTFGWSVLSFSNSKKCILVSSPLSQLWVLLLAEVIRLFKFKLCLSVTLMVDVKLLVLNQLVAHNRLVVRLVKSKLYFPVTMMVNVKLHALSQLIVPSQLSESQLLLSSLSYNHESKPI